MAGTILYPAYRRDTLARWLLRECVRANPLYVISAALLAYGVLELTAKIEPEVGRWQDMAAGLGLLHLYELCVLAVATVVLHARAADAMAHDGIGRDCHGLALVAAIFLAGSFLTFDEPIAHWPWLGPLLTPVALILVWAKLEWYARLPGLRLPPRVRYTVLGQIAAHAMAPLFGAPTVVLAIGSEAAQGAAWLLAWISMLALPWLLAREVQGWKAPAVPPDILMMRRAGACLAGAATILGIAHLLARDWVFDCRFDAWRLLPAATVLWSLGLLWRWFHGVRSDNWFYACAAPALAVQAVWCARSPWHGGEPWSAVFAPALQASLAAAAVYILLARLTGAKGFYLGLAGSLGAPVWTGVLQFREVPRFRAWLSAALGFLALLCGMILSLYRTRLLTWLEPPSPPPREETPEFDEDPDDPALPPYEPWTPPDGTRRLNEP